MLPTLINLNFQLLAEFPFQPPPIPPFSTSLHSCPPTFSFLTLIQNIVFHYIHYQMFIPGPRKPQAKLRCQNMQEFLNEDTHIHKQIRTFVSETLEFDGNCTSAKQISALFSAKKYGKYDVLKLWDQALRSELIKFAARVNSLPYGVKTNRSGNISEAVLSKLQRCSRKILQIIGETIEKKEWCLCGRDQCLSRMIPEITHKRIRDYVVNNLRKEIAKEVEGYRSEPSNQISFFSPRNDEQCNILSLQNIQKSHNGKDKGLVGGQCEFDSTVTFLGSLKIVEQERKKCCLDEDWIENLLRKRHQP